VSLLIDLFSSTALQTTRKVSASQAVATALGLSPCHKKLLIPRALTTTAFMFIRGHVQVFVNFLKFPFFGASHAPSATSLSSPSKRGQYLAPSTSVLLLCSLNPVLLPTLHGTLPSPVNPHCVPAWRQTCPTASNSLKIHTHFLQWYTAQNTLSLESRLQTSLF